MEDAENRYMRRAIIFLPLFLLLFLLLLLPLGGQTMGGLEEDSDPEAFEPPPKGFGELLLGLSFEAAEDVLYRDGNFYYRGKADLSMLRRPNERMIETAGLAYIQRCWLQFHEGTLYSITLDLDERMMDHYALYTTFTEKYGPPDHFSPSKSRWSGEDHDFVLERESLRVIYLDRERIETIRRSGKIEKSLGEMDKDRFLEQF